MLSSGTINPLPEFDPGGIGVYNPKIYKRQEIFGNGLVTTSGCLAIGRVNRG
jgi:hypothetical protein